MTSEDKQLLALLAAKIERVGARPESADRDQTLSRLLAVHGELLDQVLAESIVPDVLAELDLAPTPAPAAAAVAVEPVAPELLPSPAAEPAAPEPAPLAFAPAPAPIERTMEERIDFRGNPLP